MENEAAVVYRTRVEPLPPRQCRQKSSQIVNNCISIDNNEFIEQVVSWSVNRLHHSVYTAHSFNETSFADRKYCIRACSSSFSYSK